MALLLQVLLGFVVVAHDGCSKPGDSKVTGLEPSPSQPAAPPPAAQPPLQQAPAQPSKTATADEPSLARPASSITSKDCETLCALTEHLHCGLKPAECLTQCDNMQAPAACGQAMRVFLHCAARQPADHFECDEGSASLRTNDCDAEQAAVAKCVGAQ